MFQEISELRLETLAQAIPAGPFRLLNLWHRMSKGGQYAIYATTAYYAAKLGKSERTIRRYCRWLEDALGPLLRVTRRKVKRDYNLPNLIRMPSLRQLAAGRGPAWGR